MRYYSRYFHDSLKPYHLLDFFEVYDEAEKYDNDFYMRLLDQRKKELIEENIEELFCVEQFVFSIQYTASAWVLLAALSVDIQVKIVDTRVFFLYAITNEVYKLISKDKDVQSQTVKKVIEDYEHRKMIDFKKVPRHWKQIFDIDFMEALLVNINFVGSDMNIRISALDRIIYDIMLRDIKILYNETNVTFGVIHFAETILNGDNLEINLLTNFNEISIIAKDIDIVCQGVSGGRS